MPLRIRATTSITTGTDEAQHVLDRQRGQDDAPFGVELEERHSNTCVDEEPLMPSAESSSMRRFFSDRRRSMTPP